MTEINLKISPDFAKALIKAQSEMTSPKKDSKNPFFKSSYADLGAVRDASMSALNSNGIGVLQPTSSTHVKTVLVHESGEILDVGCDTQILFSKANDAQAQGSGITYARRYGLQSLLTLAAEDDDGNSASAKTKEDSKKEVKNNSGFSANGDLAKGEDMNETLQKKNEQDFAGLKAIIENCGSLEELTKVRNDKQNIKIVNSLKKYRPDLFDKLMAAKDFMEAEFAKEIASE